MDIFPNYLWACLAYLLTALVIVFVRGLLTPKEIRQQPRRRTAFEKMAQVPSTKHEDYFQSTLLIAFAWPLAVCVYLLVVPALIIAWSVEIVTRIATR